MDIILKRASWTMLTMIVGVVLVVILTFVGQSTKGPAEDLLDFLSGKVSAFEEKYVLNSQSHHRKDDLKWLAPSAANSSLLQKEDHFLVGAYDNSAVETLLPYVMLEQKLGTNFSLVHLYTAWGSKPLQKFPKALVHGIHDIGSIPFITWEPWLSDFNATDFPGIATERLARDKNGLKAITAGQYDTYIKQWASEAANVKKTVFVRLGHEMNDPYRYPWGPQNNKPEDFVAMWKHVHRIFDEAGAQNVVWVWSPHPAYRQFMEYYPGDDLVDWVGVGTLNYGTVATWSQWWSFKEIFGNYYNELAAFNKPIVISELGCLSVGGDRVSWFADAFQLLEKEYSMVRGLIFFNNSNDNTTTNKSLDWQVQNDSTLVKTISKGLVSLTKTVN